MAYTGTGAYKIVFTTSADVAFLTLDNVQGALDTSTFLTMGSTSTLTLPGASKTSDYTIVAADRGKIIDADATGGTFTLTLTSAVTLADNWFVIVRNAGTANPVKIAASQTIAGPWTSVGTTTSFALRPGESALIASNGATFRVPLMAPRVAQWHGRRHRGHGHHQRCAQLADTWSSIHRWWRVLHLRGCRYHRGGWRRWLF
jgi:hypothetical protein